MTEINQNWRGVQPVLTILKLKEWLTTNTSRKDILERPVDGLLHQIMIIKIYLQKLFLILLLTSFV